MKTKALIRTPRFKPSRDRMVDTLRVACPTCRVEPLVKCQKLDGTGQAASSHPKRRQMAVRADNLSRGI